LLEQPQEQQVLPLVWLEQSPEKEQQQVQLLVRELVGLSRNQPFWPQQKVSPLSLPAC
jgi:hypothetical protein